MNRVLQRTNEMSCYLGKKSLHCLDRRGNACLSCVPVELSPGGSISKDVFVYENPTPAGESRNSKLAAESSPNSKLYMLP